MTASNHATDALPGQGSLSGQKLSGTAVRRDKFRSRVQLPAVEFALPGPLRDRLIGAIESGLKTATSSLVREYGAVDDAFPAVGDRGIVIDSNEAPLFVIEIIDVQVVPLRDVPLTHAIAEGEGFKSVKEWRAGHLRFWGCIEMRAELGESFAIDDDTLAVLESFTVAR